MQENLQKVKWRQIDTPNAQMKLTIGKNTSMGIGEELAITEFPSGALKTVRFLLF